MILVNITKVIEMPILAMNLSLTIRVFVGATPKMTAGRLGSAMPVAIMRKSVITNTKSTLHRKVVYNINYFMIQTTL